MDPKLCFWTAALIDMGAAVALAGWGIHRIQVGDVAGHKRLMGWAGGLICAFLAAYSLKVPLLGKESTGSWTLLEHWVLRLHEVWVTLMLLAGAAAWRLAHGTGLVVSNAGPRTSVGEGWSASRLPHRAAGYTAVLSGLLAFTFALALFVFMYRRA